LGGPVSGAFQSFTTTAAAPDLRQRLAVRAAAWVPPGGPAVDQFWDFVYTVWAPARAAAPAALYLVAPGQGHTRITATQWTIEVRHINGNDAISTVPALDAVRTADAIADMAEYLCGGPVP
jgi:hypothetical protein